jgi:hypothetical protein
MSPFGKTGSAYVPSPSGLLLPTRLQRETPRDAEPGRTWTLANGCEVRTRHVRLGRRGWQHEVTAAYDRRGADGRHERVHDAVWLDGQEAAEQLARAAADQLGRHGELLVRAGPAVGLSALARSLGIVARAN